ncbi:MAG: DsbA family protein [Acidobacteria bacterium]|nr:DsbA family protein [Acidobacteriota bacterium]
MGSVSVAQSPGGGPATRPAQPPPASAQPPAAPAKVEPCGCEGEPLPELLATVGESRIGRAEVDDAIRAQLDAAYQTVVAARKRELDLQINSLLLEAEAKKRGTTTTKLLEQEIVAKAAAPTDAEALAFYNENKARIGAGFANVKADIVEYLRNQRERDAAAKYAQTLRAAHAVTVNQAEATPPATAADRARVFAIVNGRQITSAMIEDSLKPLIHSAQQQVYNLRKGQLDLRINDLLLEQESRKRQVTTRALLDAEVGAKKQPVTDAEVLAFYNTNTERINGAFEQVKSQIAAYLEEQQGRNLESALAARLRAAAGVQVFLREPVAPVYEIAADDQPAKGAATAAVTLVEFTDFQCPSCAQAHPSASTGGSSTRCSTPASSPSRCSAT